MMLLRLDILQLLQETFIPPSAAKLGLYAAVYKPRYITDH